MNNSHCITPEQLKEKLDKGEKPFLLDVREPFEREFANIGGHLIPIREIVQRLGELNPEEEIIVYCHTGSRSMRVVEFLLKKGFKNVKNLDGGIDASSERIDSTVPRYEIKT